MIVYQANEQEKKKEIKERTREREKERKRGLKKRYDKVFRDGEKQIQRLIKKKRAHSLGRDDRYKVIKYNDCLPAIFGVCQV